MIIITLCVHTVTHMTQNIPVTWPVCLSVCLSLAAGLSLSIAADWLLIHRGITLIGSSEHKVTAWQEEHKTANYCVHVCV